MDDRRLIAQGAPITASLFLGAFCGLLLIAGPCACGSARPARVARTSLTRALPPRDLPPNVVARVGTHSITRIALAHWTRVEAVVTHDYVANRHVPKGIVPDPPTYARCIAYLAATVDRRRDPRQSGRALLRRECETEQANVRRQALSLLITHYWVAEEAAKKRIHVSARGIQREISPWAKAGRSALASAGVRLADLLFIAAGQARLARLQHSTLPVYAALRHASGPETPRQVTRVDLELQRFSDELIKQWRPRTECRSRYMVPECGREK